MIFIGRNATDKVGNQKAFYYATSNNCASALPVKIGKHENHIFHSNGLCYIHTMHLCAVFLEEKMPSVMCLIASNNFVEIVRYPINTVHDFCSRLD